MTRILVVDSDRPQAEEFGVLLRQADCEVTLADNGREAMDLLRHDVSDVVLTDLDMPEMDGVELVQAIRRDYPALPVILMTAMGSEEVVVKGLRHRAASYVRKRSLNPPGSGGRSYRGERPGGCPSPHSRTEHHGVHRRRHGGDGRQ